MQYTVYDIQYIIYTYIIGINESLELNKYRIFRRSLLKCYFAKMLIEIVGILFDLKIQVLSFTSTFEACDARCNNAGGKLPYLHQVRDDSNRRSGRNLETPFSFLNQIHPLKSSRNSQQNVQRR